MARRLKLTLVPSFTRLWPQKNQSLVSICLKLEPKYPPEEVVAKFQFYHNHCMQNNQKSCPRTLQLPPPPPPREALTLTLLLRLCPEQSLTLVFETFSFPRHPFRSPSSLSHLCEPHQKTPRARLVPLQSRVQKRL